MGQTKMTTWSLTFTTIFLLLSMNALHCGADRLSPSDRTKLDRFIQEVMRCGGLQALSVSMVGEGGVVYERGYDDTLHLPSGLTRQGIGKDTVYCLGGSTQAFTAVLLAMLLSANQNHTMNTPVHEITGSVYPLPGQFRTYRLSLKDILAMRSGLSNMDIVAAAKGMNRIKLMQNLRFAPEVKEFRESHVYSEVLFSLVEDVARALGDSTWYQLMRHKLFQPLGMKGAGFVHTDAPDNSQVALPYLLFRDRHQQVPWDAFGGQEVVAAATSVCASASDMSKWMQFILSGGRTSDSTQLVKDEVLHSTFNPVQSRGNGVNPRTSGFTQPTVQVSYVRESNALGWIRGRFQGYSFVSQEGSLPGYESLTTLLPSRQLGVFTAFTGVGGAKAYAAKVLINTYMLDLLLQGPAWPQHGQVCDVMNKMAELTEQEDAKASSHHPRPGYAGSEDELPRPLEEYEGTYHSYAFGEVIVRRNDSGRLRLQYGEFGHYVLHPSVQNDTFIMQAVQGPLWYSTHVDDYRERGPFLALFASTAHDDPGGRPDTVTIPHFARDTDPVFSKHPVPPREAHGDCHCNNSAPRPLSVWGGLLAAVLVVLLSVVC